jgi:PBS lyase HEAT-like repeat-containing protein
MSANDASVAFCYSIQKQAWWKKLVDDVNQARSACPNAAEIVCATCIDTERDRRKPDDWLTNATAAAAPSSFRLFTGREIAHLLDTDYQDLRFDYLRIPYSRITLDSLVVASRNRTLATVKELVRSGHYDPNRYVVRSADRRLYDLWQRCSRSAGEDVRPRLVPVVNDSGLGKTSLLCRFAETFSPRLPVVLLRARDIAFDAEDSLVRYVTQVAEGVLEPTVRSGEERALAYELSKRSPLTVLVDGLDETHAPDRVRRALTFWLSSALGEHGIVIVSSRRRFWTLCSDAAWEAWIPTETGRAGPGPQDLLSRRTAGFQLPEPFDDGELCDAWVRAGRQSGELAALSGQVETELRHPFTLRAFLELDTDINNLPSRTTRTSVLDRWIAHRLRAEEAPGEFLTSDVYRSALGIIAERINKSAGSVSVEDLEGVPRFDRMSPPGPVVLRLLNAGMLEVPPERASHIRFAHEAIADFFQGEIDAKHALADPVAVATSMLGSSLSSTAQRLESIGHCLRDEASRRRFISELVQSDPARGVIAMRVATDNYEPNLRAMASDALAREIAAPVHVRAAFAADLLGHFNCAEARKALERHLPSVDCCPQQLKIIAALAVARASAVGSVSIAYANPLFQTKFDPYYFGNALHVFRTATPEFKEALLNLADADLQKDSGTAEHSRAVSALAHAGDPLLVVHLERRFHERGLLEVYENHALLAIGTQSAARLFDQSARATASKMSTLEWTDGGLARSELFHRICLLTFDVRYLLSPPFEELLKGWLQSIIDDVLPASDELAHMAVKLAQVSRSRNLARLFALAAEKIGGPGWYELDYEWIDPVEWVRWWHEAETDSVKRALIRALPSTPTAAVENVLIDSLGDDRLAAYAARYLGRIGSWVASRPLRDVAGAARTRGDNQGRWKQSEAIKALGQLRDPASVAVLMAVVRSGDVEGDNRHAAITSLATIRTAESESALVQLLDVPQLIQWVAGGLAFLGTESAVNRAIVAACETDDRGAAWLAEGVRHILFGHGFKRGEYFRHVDGRLFGFFKEHESRFPGAKKWDLVHVLEQFDGEEVRVLLRVLAGRAGTDADDVVREPNRENEALRASALAYDELYTRGDAWALSRLVAECVKGGAWGHYRSRELRIFQREAVGDAVRARLADTTAIAERVELNRLLGFFGSAEDVERFKEDIASPDEELANAAYEALMRLTDPLRLPDNWSSL